MFQPEAVTRRLSRFGWKGGFGGDVTAFVGRMTRAGWAHASSHRRDAPSQANTAAAGQFRSAATPQDGQSVRPSSSSHAPVVADRHRRGRGLPGRLHPGFRRRRPSDVGRRLRAAWPACVHRIVRCPGSFRGRAGLGIAPSRAAGRLARLLPRRDDGPRPAGKSAREPNRRRRCHPMASAPSNPGDPVTGVEDVGHI